MIPLPIMKIARILFPLFLVAVSVASDYSIKTVEILPVESYPAHVSVDDITIAADPYPNDEKCFKAFDVQKLASRGYFPVNIIIKNSSKYYLKIKTRNITLETRLGLRLYSTPAAMVVEEVIGNKYGDSISTTITGESAFSKIESPLSDFTGKELTNRLIDPQTEYSGFLFFFSEKTKKSIFIGSTLHIPNLEEEGTGKAFGPFTIPLDPALDLPK
jgi:hypothetical protein